MDSIENQNGSVNASGGEFFMMTPTGSLKEFR